MVLREVRMRPTCDRTEAAPAPRPLEAASQDLRTKAAPAGADASVRRRLSFSAGRPAPRPATTPWRLTWQWVVAAAVTALLAWLTYSRGGWIAILSAFDLGVHEFGHLLTAWMPRLLCSLAGSVLQVAAPLLLAAYFWWRRDQFAVVLMVAWSGESLHNVSVYVADAQAMALPLFGDDGSGAGHDWHNILLALNALEATDQLALALRTASVIVFVVAFGLAALGRSRARH